MNIQPEQRKESKTMKVYFISVEQNPNGLPLSHDYNGEIFTGESEAQIRADELQENTGLDFYVLPKTITIAD